MEKQMDELIKLIQSHEYYKDYKEKEKQLDKVKPILDDYQQIIHEYYDMKEYEQFQDISSIKNQLRQIKEKMTQTKEIVEYYQSYHQLNHLLQEITTIVFGHISEDLDLSGYHLQQRINK